MGLKQQFRTTVKKINGDLLTPISIFQRLNGTHKFLLESSAKYEGNGRYSFIGVNPRKTYSGYDKTLRDYSHLTSKEYNYEGELVSLLKQAMPRVSSHTEYPLTGGGIGYINVESADLLTLQFHVYDTLIIFDHLTEEIAIFHTNIEAEQKEPNIDELISQLMTVQSSASTDYTLQQENDGTATFSGDSFALYRKLRVKAPAAYMYYVEFDDRTLIGTSPESYLQIRDCALTTANESSTLERFCEKDSISCDENITQGQLHASFHALDIVKELLPDEGLIGYIGFNGQIDFTKPMNTITLIGNTAHIQQYKVNDEHAFRSLMKG